MLVGLSPNTGQLTKSESVAISASYSALSTTCWPRSLEKIGIVLAESRQPVVVSYLRNCANTARSSCVREIVTAQSSSSLIRARDLLRKIPADRS